VADLFRRAKPSSDGGGQSAAVPDEVALRYPSLFSFLVDQQWPDGGKRVPGSVLFVHEGGKFKCWINDKDAELSCWLSSDTMGGLLDGLDVALRDGGGDWRATKPNQRGGGRRG